ncbi:DUF3152 domain-containing protein [Streptomyces sp. TR06-5]|uniref:DUF3152 domain-containing protein n=1 Tax=Streptomyces sp. TR06-5 TaxID=3385976 RepID=UPI00399EF3F7
MRGAGNGERPGPRQDYLDAFEDDVFAAGASGATDAAPSVPRSRRPGERVVGPTRVGGVAGGHVPPGGVQEPAGPAGPPDDEPAEKRPGRAKAKGRTFTGVFAAAVTTVLAVVVAGQVTGIDQGVPGRAASADADSAGGDDRSAGPVTGPSDPQPAEPLTYEEKIARVLPFDPELQGPGTFTAVGGRQDGTGRGEVFRYRVEVEDELPLDGELFAEALHRTLNDERSWSHDGARSFRRVASGQDADFVVTLASPGTTGEWCEKSGLDTTEQNVSCDSAATERVMINAWRWARGSETFGDGRIRAYREMLINHEVGHRLGKGHSYCGTDGSLAPVMMQQTKTLTTDGRTCRPNAWPHPGNGGD